MYEYIFHTDYVRISKLEFFSLDKIFDCGQCFRFDYQDGFYIGVASGKYFKGRQNPDGSVDIFCDRNDFPFWADFLSLNEDYSYIRSTMPDDVTMKDASEIGKGIRILHQDKWEALCSFIISQNNNIPRIKKLVSVISEKYGKRIDNPDGYELYSFPDAKTISLLSEDDLLSLKFGFRASYIISAAKRVAEDPDFLDDVDKLDFDTASKSLEEIRGVGPKVAACTLLFGFNKLNAFPIDVWVKRIMNKYYPDIDLRRAADYFGEYAGIAQQYLFYYERYVVSRSSNAS